MKTQVGEGEMNIKKTTDLVESTERTTNSEKV